MSATGFTPIQLYYSTTAAATPSAGNLAAGELAVNITDGKLFYKDNGGVVRVLATAAGSAGDVVGPGSSTDNALVRFDGTTGKLVQSSVGVLSDAGALSGLTSVAATTFTGALTGNASTATTLQTSRTIWGQSFDGSANVTGALTGVTDLTASGSLTLNGGVANGVAYLNGSKVLTSGSALTFDGSSLGVAGRASLTSGSLSGAGNGMHLYFDTASNTGYIKGFHAGVDDRAIRLDGLNLQFAVAGSEQMRLTSTGLGIGTSAPAYKLDVNGQARLGGSTGLVFGVGTAFAGGQAEVYSTSTTPMGLGTTGAAVLRIYTNSTLQATFDTSGNLGLGTTSFASQARLQVAGGRSYFGSNDSVYAIHVAYNNTRAQAGQGYYIGATDSAAPSLVFSNNDGTARTLIDSVGNINFLAGNIYTQSTSGIFFTGTVGNFNNGIYGVGTNNVAISAGGSERARIDSSGNLLVGITSDNHHVFVKNAGNGTGTTNIFQVQNAGSDTVAIFLSGTSYGTSNSAGTSLRIGRSSSTSRSINAGGTINASGADYAEYMTKAGEFTVAKGDMVGINSDGKLTNVFADAVSFCVKSTDPSYVGGDIWGNEDAIGKRPSKDATDAEKAAYADALETARQKVDRIAFAGQVPVNVMGAIPGQYIVPVNDNGAIKGIAKNEADMTLAEYMNAVGKVIAIKEDGRAFIIVKVA